MTQSIDAIRKLEIDIAAAVATSPDTAEFLSALFSTVAKKLKFFTHTYFCKRAGFGSRNAIREIITKRKPVTHASFRKISDTLDLSPPLTSLFTLLVHKDFPNLKILQLTPKQTEHSLQRQRRIVGAMQAEDASVSASSVLFADRSFLMVYAAISSSLPGTSLPDIVTRTGLKTETITRIVATLERKDLIETQGENFVTRSGHLFFERLGGKDFFQSAYQQTADEIAKNVSKLMTQKDNLLAQSIFNVDSKQLPNLIKDLKETIAKYVDEHADDNGNRVVKLALALY